MDVNLHSLIIVETSIMPNTFGDSIRPQNNVGRQTNPKLSRWMKKRVILQNRSVMSFVHHCPGFEGKIEWEYFQAYKTMPWNLSQQVKFWSNYGIAFK